MTRKWHVEHADGREWTDAELDELAVQLKVETRIGPYNAACRAVCVDPNGVPVLLDEYGEWRYIDADEVDMEVVWE